MCFITRLSVNTAVCLETREGPCDFIFCSRSGAADGVIILVFGHSAHTYYAIPPGLIYCTELLMQEESHSEGKIKSWASMCMCMCVCVCISEGKTLSVFCVSVLRKKKKTCKLLEA